MSVTSQENPPASPSSGHRRHRLKSLTGVVYETQRSILASLLFAILHRHHARAVSLTEKTVRLTHGSQVKEVLLRDVESVVVLEGRCWSDVQICHATGNTHISALPRMEASTLASVLEEVRCEWWHRAISARIDALRSVHTRVAELADPPRYLTPEVFRQIEADARTVASGFAMRWPKTLSDNPEIQILREILEFLERSDSARSDANKVFVANELVRSRKLFDTIESRSLTEEQRRAVVVDEHRNLVVAAAGSGKTSLIVAKAGWLVRRMGFRSYELLLLSFARDARKEMEDRVRTRFSSGEADSIRVSTFHSLGLRIIGECTGKLPTLSKFAEDSEQLYNLLKEIISERFVDPKFSTVVKWFREQFAPYKSVHEFRNRSEYYDYIRKFNIRSLKGELVRSYEECEIANFLYENGVAYEHEAPYEHDLATPEKRQYKPDFHLTDYDIYIEHFGINAKGETAPYVNQTKYKEEMRWKRGIHGKYKTTLIETFSHEHASGKLLSGLRKKLISSGVTLSRLSRGELLAAYQKCGYVDSFTQLLAIFLQHFKGSVLTLADLEERTSAAQDLSRTRAFLDVFRPVYECYQEKLASSREIDFHDMINQATELVESGRYRNSFKYILVDEFQDISLSRTRLLKALLNSCPSAKLFAVGDDWQAIYRFNGSDISVMLRFGEHFGTSERLNLGTTFRCSDSINNVATEFVLRNPEQIRKTVSATRKATQPSVHIGLSEGSSSSLLKEALDRIAEDASSHDGMAEVLLLGRYRHLKPPNLSTLKKQYPGLRFSWMTVHRSKGLEADYVIVLGLCSDKYGFPSEITDDPLLDLVLATPEPYPNAEERRLLYVAITRARRQTFLLAADGPPSSFIRELIEGEYDINMFGQSLEKDMSCPHCIGGQVKRRKNSRTGNVFYGCTNYPYCEHTFRSCSRCREGLLIRSGETYRCRDCDATIKACPICNGWLEIRTGKYGRFYGCSNYPRCKYTRELRRSREKVAQASKEPIS